MREGARGKEREGRHSFVSESLSRWWAARFHAIALCVLSVLSLTSKKTTSPQQMPAKMDESVLNGCPGLRNDRKEQREVTYAFLSWRWRGGWVCVCVYVRAHVCARLNLCLKLKKRVWEHCASQVDLCHTQSRTTSAQKNHPPNKSLWFFVAHVCRHWGLIKLFLIC